MSERKPCLYTIPAAASFVDVLAQGILDKAGEDHLKLAQMQILLPTRRACRSLRESFLRITGGKPLLLPRMNPIGDVDEEELSLMMTGAEHELELKPAIAPLQRMFLLTRMIGSLPTHSRGLEQDMALARALGRLMDQIYTEDLDLKDLPNAVDHEEFSKHWQISISFLNILSENWPKILESQGVIDAADRRNKLLKRLAKDWRDNPPTHTVIAAGSTGSIPATAELLQVVANLPNGCVVLPGLDTSLDEHSWKALDDTHPQATLRHLLTLFGNINHANIPVWPAVQKHSALPVMPAFIREVMRPADTTQEWQTLKDRLHFTRDDLSIERYDCANLQEEALVIALALRETLEDPSRTAALVTPDRYLARRVAMACRRWGIEIDDSAGEPLAQSKVGTYLRLCMNACVQKFKPIDLLAFTKHTLCLPLSFTNDWRSAIREFDKGIRGPVLGDGFKTAQQRCEKYPSIQDTVNFIEQGFAPLKELFDQGTPQPFERWCEAHIKTAEYFCAPEMLWRGQDGELASPFMAEVNEQGAILGDITGKQYLTIIEENMRSIAVRPAYGLHPRLMILGQLEARLVKTDLMVLGGLNEGTWPPDPGVDPWMSRPMRKRFKLPPLERGIGLAAHDFVQAISAPKVILTRSTRVDGTPTVPSRWLQRMDTVLKACGVQAERLYGTRFLSFAQQIDHTQNYEPWGRPAPTPPLSVRPSELPVTRIETWMRDPYSIYAERILRLRKLKPLEQDMDAALRGTLVHKVLERFIETFKNDIPPHAQSVLMGMIDEELNVLTDDPALIALWRPRLEKMSEWLVFQERKWREDMIVTLMEKQGHFTLSLPDGNFTLTAKADRIDVTKDGTSAAIIDYKSAGSFSAKGIKNGTYPQLPLEAVIIEANGFEGIQNKPVSQVQYWIVNGSKDGGNITALNKPADLENAKMNARAGLEDLVRTFHDTATPYYSLPQPEKAPRYNDYEHLARVLEWTALDEGEDAA
jgi:ATP-dependent helicase/nuclease subunit B